MKKPIIYVYSQFYHDELDKRGVPTRVIKLITGYGIYGKDENGDYDKSKVDDATVRKVAEAYTGRGPVVLDIEAWSIRGENDDFEFVYREFERALAIWRETHPNLRLGMYSYLPVRNYWAPVLYDQNPEDAEREAAFYRWRRLNAKWRRNHSGSGRRTWGFADKVDFVAPSFYAPYPRPEQWRVFAEALLREAARYQKPILTWVWGGFSGSSAKYETKHGDYIGDDFLRLQLETIADFGVEGIILFDLPKLQKDEGPNRTALFDTVAKWYGR